MPLSFEPACLPLVRSEMPHRQATDALSFLRDTLPAILPWPHLPARQFRERLAIQSTLGFPGLVLDDVAKRAFVVRAQAETRLDQLALAYLEHNHKAGEGGSEDAPGLVELLRIAPDHIRQRCITSQLFGPVSLGLHLTDETQRPLHIDPVYREALGQHLALRTAWLSARLAALHKEVIICLHEPLLTALDSAFAPLGRSEARDLLDQVLVMIEGCRGVIISDFGLLRRDSTATLIWELLMDTSVELIVLDRYYDANILGLSVEALPAFLERPGMIGWGLIPGDPAALAQETVETLLIRFRRTLAELSATGVSQDTILRQSFVGISGSLAEVPVEVAERAVRLCVDVSARLRQTYDLVPTSKDTKE